MNNPYREDELVLTRKAPAKRSGCIVVDVVAPHKCKSPGWLRMMWYDLVGKKLSLWRCKGCGSVREYHSNHTDGWSKAGVEEWIKAGGSR